MKRGEVTILASGCGTVEEALNAMLDVRRTSFAELDLASGAKLYGTRLRLRADGETWCRSRAQDTEVGARPLRRHHRTLPPRESSVQESLMRCIWGY